MASASHASQALIFPGAAPRRPGLALRLRVLISASRLDARVAEGAEASGNPRLELRGAQLTSRRMREGLARALERACERASGRQPLSAAVRAHPLAVEVARPALAQLANVLHSREPVAARGVARTRLLLTEPASPLYAPSSRGALYEAARDAHFALRDEERR